MELNDEEILSVLRTQGQRASISHRELVTAKGSIGELHDTMGQILEEANQTQTKVDVICKDIRAMDHAKRNLTQSISVLENFGTLTDALNDLKETSNDRCACFFALLHQVNIKAEKHTLYVVIILFLIVVMSVQGKVCRECIQTRECAVLDGQV